MMGAGQRRATHPAMQVVRPPVTAGQLPHQSFPPRLASVEDMDDDDKDFDDGNGRLWKRGRRDPVIAIVVVDDNNKEEDDCIVEAEQRGGTAKLPIGGAATTTTVFLVLVLIGIILSGVSVVVGIVGNCRVVALLRCCRCYPWSSQPSLPPLPLPPSSRQPLLLPPMPLLQPSVDGWLFCCLLRHLLPYLSSAAFGIVRSSTLLPPAAIPYGRRPSPAAVLSINFMAPINGWLLRSPPA